MLPDVIADIGDLIADVIADAWISPFTSLVACFRCNVDVSEQTKTHKKISKWNKFLYFFCGGGGDKWREIKRYYFVSVLRLF